MKKFYCDYCRVLYDCEKKCDVCGMLADKLIFIHVQNQPNKKN